MSASHPEYNLTVQTETLCSTLRLVLVGRDSFEQSHLSMIVMATPFNAVVSRFTNILLYEWKAHFPAFILYLCLRLKSATRKTTKTSNSENICDSQMRVNEIWRRINIKWEEKLSTLGWQQFRNFCRLIRSVQIIFFSHKFNPISLFILFKIFIKIKKKREHSQ